MDLIDISGVIVAIIAALGAWAAQRAAVKATRINTTVSGRLEAERGAYERARAFDIQTIDRQNEEIDELHEDNRRLRLELRSVKERLKKLEIVLPEWERLLHERLGEEANDQE